MPKAGLATVTGAVAVAVAVAVADEPGKVVGNTV